MNQLGDQEAQILAYSQAVKENRSLNCYFSKQKLSLNEKLDFRQVIYEKDESLSYIEGIGFESCVKEKKTIAGKGTLLRVCGLVGRDFGEWIRLLVVELGVVGGLWWRSGRKASDARERGAGTSDVNYSAGTSQTPNANASEEKDEDAELIVVPSANEASSTDTSEDNPKILAFRRELEAIAQKHLGTTMLELEIFHKSETGIFDEASYDEEGVVTDFNSLPTEIEDKYVAEILKKFDLVSVKTAITPMETKVALTKDEEAVDVDVTPKTSHLNAVKRIFKYLKGKPNLGLWYPRESPFDLEAFSDSDYGGSNLDRKSTTGGCQFLGQRLISWQCKKQTIVATSTTEAEYVAAANYPVYHSKTKHIEIRHHFIRDCYEKKLIRVEKIHTDLNVADLLTKPFDGPRHLLGSSLKFADASGITMLPNNEIFEGMGHMGGLQALLPAMLSIVAPSAGQEAPSVTQPQPSSSVTFGKAILTLVERVKSLEVALKRKTKRVLLFDSEEEETEAQGRKTHDLDPLKLLHLNQKFIRFKSVEKERYKRRKSSKRIFFGMVLDFEEVKSAFEEVSTGGIKVSSGIEEINTGSLDMGEREGKAPMTEEEETQASRKTKEQILQEEAGLAEAIRLDALEKALEKEEVAKQVHLDSLLAQRLAEEQELIEVRPHKEQFEAFNIVILGRRSGTLLSKSLSKNACIGRVCAWRRILLLKIMQSKECTKIPINHVPVAIKSPSIANYKIIKQGRKDVYQIVRENGTDMHGINKPEENLEKKEQVSFVAEVCNALLDRNFKEETDEIVIKLLKLMENASCRPWTCTFLVAKGLATPELMANCVSHIVDLDLFKLVIVLQRLYRSKNKGPTVELHHVKQKEGESTEAFMERYTSESLMFKGAPELMRIYGFMHGITHPGLIKRLNDYILKLVDEMISVTKAFIRGEKVAANQWRPRDKRSDQFTQLTKTPKEILAMEAGKGTFTAPPPMSGASQIEEAVRSGQLAHLVKEIKQGSNKASTSKLVKRDKTSQKDKGVAIFMVQSWGRNVHPRYTLGRILGRNHLAIGTNSPTCILRKIPIPIHIMDELFGGSVTLPVQWDPWETEDTRYRSATVYRSWHNEVPNKGRSGH
ncbi:hypothetical protein Tco_1524704 [Tanacetum coccineum]